MPAVAIVASGFIESAKATARALGIPYLPLAEYAGVIMTESIPAFRQKIESSVVPSVLNGMTALSSTDNRLVVEEPNFDEAVFSGNLDAVQDYYYERGWTDGLPIIPPTRERVNAFLARSDRSPSDVIGVLPPEQREATVWNTAVNGVMAGCRPQYFTILLGIVEALTDPDFRIEDAGSTPGWEPLVIVSGSIAKLLNFNSGSGALRVGRQANTTIGRFVRMYMRNVAGLRIPPFGTDKGSIGYTFNVALAEDDDAITALGWQPFRVDRGFGTENSVVTVQSVVAISGPIYSAGDDAQHHLEAIAQRFAETIGSWCFTGLIFQRWHPLLVLGPPVARIIAGEGLTKDDVRAYLREHMRIRASDVEEGAWRAGVTSSDFKLHRLVAEGGAPQEYGLSNDPARLVPMCPRADWINIVVAGDPARNQSRAYVNNHSQGPPVSRLIQYRPERLTT